MQAFMDEIATNREHEPDKQSGGLLFELLNIKGKIFI